MLAAFLAGAAETVRLVIEVNVIFNFILCSASLACTIFIVSTIVAINKKMSDDFFSLFEKKN